MEEAEVRDGRLRRLLDLARESPVEQIALEWASARRGMSSRTFSRFHADRTSLSPRQWKRRIKLREVRELLPVTNQPLKQVASSLGCRIEAGLHRSILQVIGCTPQQHRNLFVEVGHVPSRFLVRFPGDGGIGDGARGLGLADGSFPPGAQSVSYQDLLDRGGADLDVFQGQVIGDSIASP